MSNSRGQLIPQFQMCWVKAIISDLLDTMRDIQALLLEGTGQSEQPSRCRILYFHENFEENSGPITRRETVTRLVSSTVLSDPHAVLLPASDWF